MLRWAKERKWTQVESGLGRGGLTGVLCSAIEVLLMGRMRGGNELSPAPRERLEVFSQRGQKSHCLLHPDGAAMGSTRGSHPQGGRLDRGRTLEQPLCPVYRMVGWHTRLTTLLGARGISVLGASVNPSMDSSVPWILGQSKSKNKDKALGPSLSLREGLSGIEVCKGA